MRKWSFSGRVSMLSSAATGSIARSPIWHVLLTLKITDDLTKYVWWETNIRYDTANFYHNQNGSLEFCPQDPPERVNFLYRWAVLICGYPYVVDESSLICWSEAIADQANLVLDEHNGNITERTQNRDTINGALKLINFSLLYMFRCRQSLKVWSLTKQSNLSLHLALEIPTISSLYRF